MNFYLGIVLIQTPAHAIFRRGKPPPDHVGLVAFFEGLDNSRIPFRSGEAPVSGW